MITPLRLLLVEDSNLDARALMELLKELDPPPQLTHALTLEKALAHLAEQTFDCVLLDMRLPDGEGVESVDRIHSLCREVTIVVLTGNDDEHAALAALHRGAQEYIIKGKHDGEALLQKLRHAIERDRLVITLKRQRQEDYHRASHDALTGLPNRLLFEDRLRAVLAQGLRRDNRPVVCFVDLDRFKAVNDVYGHATGDTLLQEVARVLQDSVRTSDTVARLGGDEFAILLNYAGDAALVAERMVQRIAAIESIGGEPIQIGASIGLAQHPQHGTDYEQLLVNADAAMYRAKAAGKGQWRFFSPPKAAASDVAEPNAFSTLVLQLHYQPWYLHQSQRCMGLEALIRMQGSNAADSVLQEAERQKLLPLLGSWVLEQACRNWLSAQQSGAATLRLAVNISAAELDRRDYASSTLRLLGELGMPCTALQLEVTEDDFVTASSTLLDNIGVLRQRGVRVALDRFGRNQAALALLKNWPVDVVKLDIRHVHELRTQPAAGAFLTSVISYVQALGHELILCGVETQADLENLKGLAPALLQGVMLQGFGLAPPLPLTTPRAALLPC